jgi:CDP-2,3-bis-(O-geranylgeranyl)-sn-glycerol synthase
MDTSAISTDLLLLALITVANGAPWLIGLWLGSQNARPVDGGRLLSDGQPLLGRSKTWRGLATALAATPLLAMLFAWQPSLGLAVGAAAMIGDLSASYLKRRLGLAPSTNVPGLDQIPEALFPALIATFWLELDWRDLGFIVGAFFLGHLITRRLIARFVRSL